jgi:hypothetical protein
LRNNSGDDVFLNVEELGNTLNDVMIRVQTTLSRPIVNLGSTVNKWIFAASVLSRMGGRILFITLVAMGLFGAFGIFAGNTFSFMATLNQVIQNRIYQAILVIAVVFSMRLILFRLRDRDLNNNNGRTS